MITSSMVRCVVWAGALALFWLPLVAGEWTDAAGRPVTGEVTAVYGGVVAISSGHQSRLVPLERLSREQLARVAEALASQPSQPVTWSESTSPVAKALSKRLQVRDGEKLVDFNPGDRIEPEFYLVYFSAHWCGPCRRFTPRLVKAYHAMKAESAFADQFELVFVSSDRDAKEQLKYVNEAEMPWPVLKYSQVGKARVLERWSGRGIPCLVVVNRAGEVLFHSYQGDNYVGPDEPLNAARALLGQLSSDAPSTRAVQHPLAVARHVHASREGKVQPRPYTIVLDPEIYRRAGVTSLKVIVTVSEEGRVTDVGGIADLSAVTADRVRQDATKWLFLPAVEDGRAVTSRVAVPLTF